MPDKYDTFWARLFAGFIDGLVFVPISMITVLLPVDTVAGQILNVTLLHASTYIYSVYFHWRWGQTIGKMAMGIRVVDVDEERLLTFEQAFRRDSFYIFIETIGILIVVVQIIRGEFNPLEHYMLQEMLGWMGAAWFLLEIFTMLLNDKRRALHDILADSVVIKEDYWKGPKKTNCARD